MEFIAGNLGKEDNDIEPSEVLVTFRITLAFSSLVVLGAISSNWKMYDKIFTYVGFFGGYAIYFITLCFSWRKCWFPPSSTLFKVMKDVSLCDKYLLIVVFIDEIIRQALNRDSHISNICQSIINGDIDKKRRLKGKFERLKRRHKGEPEERVSPLCRIFAWTLGFIETWGVPILFLILTFSAVIEISELEKKRIPDYVALRMSSAIFISMTLFNDVVIEKQLIMELLKISHRIESDKLSSEEV